MRCLWLCTQRYLEILKGISESSHLCSQQSVKLLHTKTPGSLEPGFKFNFSNISKSVDNLIHE